MSNILLVKSSTFIISGGIVLLVSKSRLHWKISIMWLSFRTIDIEHLSLRTTIGSVLSGIESCRMHPVTSQSSASVGSQGPATDQPTSFSRCHYVYVALAPSLRYAVHLASWEENQAAHAVNVRSIASSTLAFRKKRQVGQQQGVQHELAAGWDRKSA